MPVVICRVCNKNFYIKPNHQRLGWGKYCSITCRSKSQLKGKDVVCDVCGKKVHRSPSQIAHSKSGQFFCTKKCQTLWRNKYFIGEKHANWISGESTYRKILIRAGSKQVCKLCGISNKIVLTVHHINHDRQNNDVSNLVWLCFNCHYIVHHDQKTEKSLQKSQIQG